MPRIPHTRPRTMHEVAARAGVAISSVSRVLSGHPDVSEAMKQKVLRAVAELGYEPDLLAQSLRSGSTHMVGLLVRDISNPLFGQIARGAEEELRRHGYVMTVTNSSDDMSLEAAHINLLRRRRVDGIIASLVTDDNPAADAALREFRGAVVLLDREPPNPGPGAGVMCDHHRGVESAVGHLLDSGHKRVALVTGTPSVWPTRERIRAYQDAHSARGLRVSRALITAKKFDADVTREATLRLLRSPNPPTAVVAAGAQCAEGALLALDETGVRIGIDVAFVACDGSPLFRLIDPAIGMVNRDAELFGRRAAETLLGLLAGEAPTDVLVPTVYVPGVGSDLYRVATS